MMLKETIQFSVVSVVVVVVFNLKYFLLIVKFGFHIIDKTKSCSRKFPPCESLV